MLLITSPLSFAEKPPLSSLSFAAFAFFELPVFRSGERFDRVPAASCAAGFAELAEKP